MKGDIREYARIGLVHHMLYSDSLDDPREHTETLLEFIRRDDIDTFDCCLPAGGKECSRLVPEILACGKEDIAFAAHLFPMEKLHYSTTLRAEQEQIRLILKEMIEQAVSIRATGFIFPSGGPSPAYAAPGNYTAFAGFCVWLCGELKKHGMTAMLEPFDTRIDKKFLYGPTADCVSLIESLPPEIDNLAIELDLAHVPLMGESFEGAIRTVSPYLKRVHLGNCVLRDKTNSRYGDTHPPIGFPGGEIDIPELTQILKTLMDTGYLDKKYPGSILLEMTPWPGRGVEESVADGFARLKSAWEAV